MIRHHLSHCLENLKRLLVSLSFAGPLLLLLLVEPNLVVLERKISDGLVDVAKFIGFVEGGAVRNEEVVIKLWGVQSLVVKGQVHEATNKQNVMTR